MLFAREHPKGAFPRPIPSCDALVRSLEFGRTFGPRGDRAPGAPRAKAILFEISNIEVFGVALLSGAGAVALGELVKYFCQLARRSRVTDLTLLWGLVRVKRDPLEGEEIVHDAESEEPSYP